MIWGIIIAQGVGRIVHIEGNLTKELYCKILEDNILRTYHKLCMKPHAFYFQQDNDLKHTAKIVKAWFKENNIDLLPWPANSPDLNIIEKLWNHLDHKIWAQKPWPYTEDKL
jgi:hypothetical protein